MSLLDGINTSSDVKKLSVKQLDGLCDEIRTLIIDTAKNNGGHLSANLGIVETTVALHYVFDFPKDKLIFDVGHQCYTHKILTGRKNEFKAIRQDGGLSGFPSREESEYDLFTTGHAGTSIAAGLGLAKARDAKGEDYTIINVVGDGSFVNGLNLEAVTSLEEKPKNYIVVLNDNGMSISQNGNGLYKFISKETASRAYQKSKSAVKRIFGDTFVRKCLSKIKGFLKRLLGGNSVFETFGFKYVGITDGNDVKKTVKILRRVRNAAKYKAVLLHLKTTKGKGYAVAEENSETFHGVGKNLSAKTGGFSCLLGDAINKSIENGENVFAITAGMKTGTGLAAVENAHKERFIDVGIAEEYAVTLAAGMAAGGVKPVVAVYSTFMQRAYDQILHDVCLQNLPVIFCLDRAGLVGADGQTHQGVFDLSYLTHLPNMTVYAPSSKEEFNEVFELAKKSGSPTAIRYPTETAENHVAAKKQTSAWKEIKEGSALTVIAEGPRMIELAIKVADKLNGVRVINALRIKPLDVEVLRSINSPLVVLEENSVIGGLGSLILGYLSENGIDIKTAVLGIKDKFVKHGSVARQLKDNGLTEEDVLKTINKKFGL
ncbi:MAG: 1-deoxy-D-xylulose-5-phosphate synthase [Clostridia bacterium]|nr:1-deoxy-D-xylulose-5-phosphate synthase [Clostridia bacterium]